MDQMFCEKNEEKNDFSSVYLIFWGMKNDLLNVCN